MKLKNFIIKYWTVFLVFAVSAGVVFLFASRKGGMFIDEVYSYGLSNSYYAPYVSSVKGGILTDAEFTRQDIIDYLSVGEDDRFAYGSVYYNQTRDVHPPLYYWLFNTVSSLFPGNCSKWIGLGLNIGIFFLSLLVLFCFVRTLFGSIHTASAAVALYGTAVLTMSMVMMIRMYTLLAFFTILLADVTVHIVRDPENPWLYPLLTFVLFCGMMTQYYFVFYASFLCLGYLIYALVRRRFNSLMWFAICALLGVALMIAVFPASIRQLFVGNGQVVGGSSVISTLRNFSAYRDRIDIFRKTRFKLKGVDTTLIAAGLLTVLTIPGFIRACRAKKIRFDALLIILPVIPAFLLTAVISPVSEQRYVYNLIPIAVLAAAFLMHTAGESFHELVISRVVDDKKEAAQYITSRAAVLAVTAAAVLFAKRLPPDNLFTDHRIINELCEAHSSTPCVYISDEKFASITQDLLQLKYYDSFFVTNDPSSEKMKDYIGDSETAILYIDTNSFWSSGYDAEKVIRKFAESTGLEDSRLLYSFSYEGNDGLSSTYVMSK